MANDLGAILEAMKNWVFPTPEIEKQVVERARICMDCPNNKNNVCTVCGCPLALRLRSTKKRCPDDPPRW